MPRTRTKVKDVIWNRPSIGINNVTTARIEEFFSESSYPGSCACTHWKADSLNIRTVAPNGSVETFIGHPADPCLNSLLSQVQESLYALNWDKLPTSTGAGLIQLIAEFDDTVAAFTLKFWRSLSYGSFTWGVLPLVSDLKAIGKALSNLNKALEDFNYADSFDVNLTSPQNTDGVSFRIQSGTATVRKSGRGDISFQHPGALALDKLGFHPGLATVWDLVPLSFLIDYILPIGDFLSSYETSGWVQAIWFKGWVTIDATYQVVFDHTYPGYTGNYPTASVTTFIRFPYIGTLTEVPHRSDPPGLALPTLKQLFDLLYVFVYSKHKNRVPPSDKRKPVLKIDKRRKR